MDPIRFDSLTRSLHDVRSRRAVLATLLSGALAVVGVPALAGVDAQAIGDRSVKTQGSGGQKKPPKCLPLARPCVRKPKKGSAAEKRGCKRCCASVTIVDGRTGRCCNHEGLGCATTDQCCLGVCTEGTCQGAVIQLPAPPPTDEPPPPPPTCVPYAGVCTLATDCCSGIPCTGSRCRYP